MSTQGAWIGNQARLKLGVALLNMQEATRAREAFLAVDPHMLDERGLLSLCEGLAQIGEVDRAATLLPANERPDTVAVRQLISLVQGTLPDGLLDRPVLMLRRAQLKLAQGDLADAARVACNLVDRGLSEGPMLCHVAAVMTAALEETVWENMPLALPIPLPERPRVLTGLTTAIDALGRMELPDRLREIREQLSQRLCGVTQDEERYGELTASLQGEPEGVDDTFESALEHARRGDLAEALTVLPRSNHPWRTSLQQAVLRAAAGHFDEALVELAQLQKVFPNRMPIEAELSRMLGAKGNSTAALGHAQTAFSQLPGIGQRTLLARCLLANERFHDAWELLADIDLRGRPQTTRIAAIAADAEQPNRAMELWKAYLSLAPNDWQARLRYAILMWQRGEIRKAADEAWQAFSDAHGDSQPCDDLFQVAILQRMGDLPVDEADARVAQVAERIKRRAAGNRDAEMRYLELFLDIKHRTQLPPPDYKLLHEQGMLFPVAAERVVTRVRESVEQQQVAHRLYALGSIPCEAFCDAVGICPAQLVSGAFRSDFRLAGPVGPALLTPFAAGGKRLLVGELELCILQELGLLSRLWKQVDTGKVVIFEDALERLRQAPLMLSQRSQPGALARLDALWQFLSENRKVAIVKGRDERSDEELSRTQAAATMAMPGEGPADVELAAVLRFLADSGRAPPAVVERATWSFPPAQAILRELPKRLAVSFGALMNLWEHDLLRPLVEGAAEGLFIGPHALGTFESLRLRLRAGVEATRLATHVYEQVARNLDAHIHIIKRPEIKSVPVVGEPAVHRWFCQSLSWREALWDDASLTLISGDYLTTALFSGGTPVDLVREVIRDPRVYRTLAARMRENEDRIVPLTALVHALAEPRERPAVVRQMVRLGFQDGFTPDDMLALAAEYGGLSKSVPSQLLDGVELIAKGGHPGALVARMAMAQLFARTIWAAWKGAVSAEIATDITRSLLDRAEGLSGHDPECILDSTLGFIGAALLTHLEDSYVPAAEDRKSLNLDPAAPAGRTWACVAEWAQSKSSRAAAYRRAVQQTCLVLDSLSTPSGVSEARIYTLLHAATPLRSDDGSIISDDVDAAALACLSAVWPVRLLELTSVTLSRNDDERQSVVNPESVLSQAANRMNAGEAAVRLSGPSASFEFRLEDGIDLTTALPAEAVLLRLSPERVRKVAPELARNVAIHDGLLASLLEGLARTPDDSDLKRQVARQAARTPWRAIRSDPCHITRWGGVLEGSQSYPKRLPELLEILSERPVGDSAIVDVLAGRLADNGFWRSTANPYELAKQAMEQPGSLSGLLLNSRTHQDTISDEVEDAVQRLSHVHELLCGEISSCVHVLRAAVEKDSRTTLRDGRPLRDVLPGLLGVVLNELERPPPEHTVAWAEPSLLRICSRTVHQLALALDEPYRERVWLTYRLARWLVNQLRVLDPEACSRAVTELEGLAAQIASPGRPGPDAMDPERVGWGRYDLRLATYLEAMLSIELSVLNQAEGRDGATAFPSWLMTGEVKASLARIASRGLSAEEQALRLADPRTLVFPWRGPVAAPDLALCVLLWCDTSALIRLDPDVRVRWLQQLPRGPGDGESLPRWVIFSLLHAAANHIAALSEMDRAILRERLIGADLVALGTPALIAAVCLYDFGCDDLRSPVISAIGSLASNDEWMPRVAGLLVVAVAGRDEERVVDTVDKCWKAFDAHDAQRERFIAALRGQMKTDSGNRAISAAVRLCQRSNSSACNAVVRSLDADTGERAGDTPR